MNDVFYGKPEPMVSNYEEEKQFIHGVCKCSFNTTCIRIPRSFSNTGMYNFHCTECGTEGVVIVNKRDLGNGERKAVTYGL